MGTSERASDGGAGRRVREVEHERIGALSTMLNSAVMKRKCGWGFSCRFGTGCLAWHSFEEQEHFAVKQEVRRREWEERCGFCVRGSCKYGDGCRRGIEGRNTIGMTIGMASGEREQESDYESAEEEPPESPEILKRARGPRVEESWSEDWGEEVVAGRVSLQDRQGEDWLVAGGGYSVLSAAKSEDDVVDTEDAFVFKTRAREDNRKDVSGRKKEQGKASRIDTPPQQQHQQQHGRQTEQTGARLTCAAVAGQGEIQSWARRIATGGDKSEGESEETQDEEKTAIEAMQKLLGRAVAVGRRARMRKMWEEDPCSWGHEEWARVGTVEKLAGCISGVAEYTRCCRAVQWWEQQAESRRRRPVEEMKGEGEMRHKPG
jgi:hypothetical protein